MLRSTRIWKGKVGPSTGYRGMSAHTAPSQPKYLDKPGMWNNNVGPQKDTVQARMAYARIKTSQSIGMLTKPFRTPKAKIVWRKFTNRVFKSTVFSLVFLTAAIIIMIIVTVVFYANSKNGPSTPTMERKAREHRLSRQIIQMVREREREIHTEHELLNVAANIDEANRGRVGK